MRVRFPGFVVGAAVLYTTRRFYRNWGATKDESRERLRGDALIGDPAVQTTSAVTVDAPVEAVWQLLLHIGCDNAGLYRAQEFGRGPGGNGCPSAAPSPRRQPLVVGDFVWVVHPGGFGVPDGVGLTVVEMAAGESLVLRTHDARWPYIDAVVSFHVRPRWEDDCRLIARTRTGMRHPGEVLGVELFGPVQAMAIRALLRNVRRHAERHTARRSVVSVVR